MNQHASSRRLWMSGAAALIFSAGASVQATAKRHRIGILKFDNISPLELDEAGFLKGLMKSGYKEDSNIELIRRTCRGQIGLRDEMARELLSHPLDLVYAIGTPAAEGIFNARGNAHTLPFIFSSVTDPVAAKIVPKNISSGQLIGMSMTGTSTPWPIGLQLRFYASLLPDTKTWGTIYNKNEINSVSHVTLLRMAAERIGISLVEETVASGDEVAQAAERLVKKVQAIVISADNTSVARMEAIAAACNQTKTPLFAGTSDSILRGAAVVFGIDFFLVGYASGRKAALVLKGMNAGEIPWSHMQKFSLSINTTAAEKQGLSLPRKTISIADYIYN